MQIPQQWPNLRLCQPHYVQAGVYDAFAEKLSAAVAKLKMGDGLSDGTSGPLISDKAIAKVKEHIADATAKVQCDLWRRQLSGRGPFPAATIVTGPPVIWRSRPKETFGPLAPLFKFDDVDEVIELSMTRFSVWPAISMPRT